MAPSDMAPEVGLPVRMSNDSGIKPWRGHKLLACLHRALPQRFAESCLLVSPGANEVQSAQSTEVSEVLQLNRHAVYVTRLSCEGRAHEAFRGGISVVRTVSGSF